MEGGEVAVEDVMPCDTSAVCRQASAPQPPAGLQLHNFTPKLSFQAEVGANTPLRVVEVLKKTFKNISV